MRQYDIALIGGDARIAFMLPYLVEKGYRVICYGLSFLCDIDMCEGKAAVAASLREAVTHAGCIVGGVPFLKGDAIYTEQPCKDMKPDELLLYMREGQILFGGVLPDVFVSACRTRNVTCFDYMKEEAYVIYNAIATAEGCILEAIKQQNTNIHESQTLVLGYGRCAKVLAQKLQGLGAKVTICARNVVDLAYAEACGMKTMRLSDLESQIETYEYIYNTVPAKVLTENVLKRVRKDALIIDIASAPGGVDDSAAECMAIRVLHCYGLPGKYAPKASAKGLAELIAGRLEGR